MNPIGCRIGDYYPDHPTDSERETIRGELVRQWACIASGDQWDPDRPPEPILAILRGHLAWCRIPGLNSGPGGSAVIPDGSPFHLNGELPWVKTWRRPDGVYLTLSAEGAKEMGVRPVGLTMRRRKAAKEAGITDAVWDVWERTRMSKRGNLLLRYLRPTKKHPAANPPPLYRWAPDTEAPQWRVAPQAIGGTPIMSLEAIGTEGLADECCQAEKEKVFRREDPEAERIRRAVDIAPTLARESR